MRRLSVVLLVLLCVVMAPIEAHAQTGLLHGAREQAAGMHNMMVRIFGEPIGPDEDWSVHDPVIDGFTDEQSQAATLDGINGNLVLVVGCNAGSLFGVGIGGLTDRLLFQDGDIDLRWGDGSVDSQGWVDADRVLIVPERRLNEFLRYAARENRLRIRANVTRNRFVQDEFNLANLTVSSSTVRMDDPPRGQTARKILSCSR